MTACAHLPSRCADSMCRERSRCAYDDAVRPVAGITTPSPAMGKADMQVAKQPHGRPDPNTAIQKATP